MANQDRRRLYSLIGGLMSGEILYCGVSTEVDSTGLSSGKGYRFILDKNISNYINNSYYLLINIQVSNVAIAEWIDESSTYVIRNSDWSYNSNYEYYYIKLDSSKSSQLRYDISSNSMSYKSTSPASANDVDRYLALIMAIPRTDV